MVKYSVPNYATLLNEKIAVSQLLSEYRDRAYALLDATLTDNFFQKNPLMLHRFFCNVSDIVKKAKKLNDDLLDALLKIMSVIANNENYPPSDGSIH
jgi:hypothetical protein